MWVDAQRAAATRFCLGDRGDPRQDQSWSKLLPEAHLDNIIGFDEGKGLARAESTSLDGRSHGKSRHGSLPRVNITPRFKNVENLLAAARRLPRQAQAELAEVLLREAGEPAGHPVLETLRGMSEADLVALAGGIVAPGRQRRMKALLRKNEQNELGETERRELDALLEEADRLALLKAKAAYTLVQLRGPRTAAA